MKEAERLQEGWVSFIRHYCKEGHIDYWMGDCINDPNKPTKSGLQLNAMKSCLRLNDGVWVNTRDLASNAISLIYAFKPEYSAKEIWDTHRSLLGSRR